MKKLAVAAAILVSTSLSAMAAPFCLEITGTAPQCMYADGNECQADANRQNGACVPNPANWTPPYQQDRRILHDLAHRPYALRLCRWHCLCAGRIEAARCLHKERRNAAATGSGSVRSERGAMKVRTELYRVHCTANRLYAYGGLIREHTPRLPP